MVLGLGSKKKGATVKVEFQIQLQEIKPWMAASASGAKTPLLVQWQRGDNRYGKTRSVVPKQEDGGKVVFNETFRLPAKLVREPEGKGRNAGIATFQKKTIVFTVLEATTDLQLARCVLDLAEYGDLDSRVPASIPMAVGKKVAAGGQTPTLFLTIGHLEKKEERSFSSRVSFGSSTPRNSISKAPDAKVEARVSVSGKSKTEPALDEETRKSIVAALLNDDDDNVSIESFTDDEGTPEDSTARSNSTPKSSTSRSEVAKSSTAPTRPEAPKPHSSIPDTTPKSGNKSSSSSSSSSASKLSPAALDSTSDSVNKLRSSSSTPQSAIQTSTEGHTSGYNPSYTRPTPTKHGPAKATQSSATAAAEESAEGRPVKHGSGKATESSTPSADEFLKNFRPAVTSTASPTQLFSTDPVYKSTKEAENLASDSVNRPSKDLPSSESGSQSIKGIKRPTTADQSDEAPRAALILAETTTSSSTSSKVSRGTPASNSLEAPHAVTNKSMDKTDSSSSSGEKQTAREIARTEIPKSPEKELPQKTALPLPPASAKAAAAAAASAYAAKRTFVSSRGSRSSFDYSNESSDDSLSESSNGGRSRGQPPPLRDQPQASGRSVSSSEPFGNAKRGGDNGGGRKIESKISVQEDERKDGSKPIVSKSADPIKDIKATGGISTSPDPIKDIKATGGIRTSPDPIKNIKSIGGVSENPDVKKDGGGESQTKAEAAIKPEEPVEEGTSVLGSARANLAKVEKRALEELRTKITNAEAKILAESQKVEKLQGELRDVGAMEVSLYCVAAEHGSSSHKLHTPARRLARLYMHAYKHWSPERRAGTAKNSVSGLVTVAKSCGADVSRLSFWWSNVVALRTVFTQAFDTGSPSVSQADTARANTAGTMNGNGSTGWTRRSFNRSSFTRQGSKPALPSPKSPSTDWQEPSTYIAALEKIEEWIYSKIVESLWWQAMIPRMQKNVDASTPTSPRGVPMFSPSALFGSEFTNKAKEDLSKLAGDVTGMFVRKPSRISVSLPELGDARQGNMSVEIWKKAIMEALRRLCPVRGAGHDCGCLPMLIRMAIEGCVARLDVALFNAILREPNDDVPTDPLSDPVSDSSVLPISPGGLTFGGGSQLKNVVVTWSTFIAGLVSLKEPVFVPEVESRDDTETSEESEKSPKFFSLIKATGDLLMLPKDILIDRNMRKEEARQEAEKSATLFVMLRTTGDILQLPKDILMDKSVRREICPMLSLQLIRRILANFVPDEFAPDPISPSLLAALNAEASIEKQRQGEAYDISSSIPMAEAPPITYVAPPAYFVWPWIGEANADQTGWGRSNNSLLRKGYTSDEDLLVMEHLQKSSASDKLEFLVRNSRQGSLFTAIENYSDDSATKSSQPGAEISGASRFRLLQEVWGTS